MRPSRRRCLKSLRQFVDGETPQSANSHTVLRGLISRAFALIRKRFANLRRKSTQNCGRCCGLPGRTSGRFHERQLEKSWEIEGADGVRLGQRILPLQSVGLYVPGGTAAYPSTVLMNAVPAQIAGVPRIVVATPPHQFHKSPVIAAVLEELGLDEVYGIGGAQAVAALAYGTETVPKVNKIVGPGNIYVATAKRQVYGVVDIDMIAGPSEVVVVADDSVDPDFVAADLMAQAEHDENACAIAVVVVEGTRSGCSKQRGLSHQESQPGEDRSKGVAELWSHHSLHHLGRGC